MRHYRFRLALTVVGMSGCATSAAVPVAVPEPAIVTTAPVIHTPSTPALSTASPSAVGMDPSFPARLDSIVSAALANGVAPGATVAVGRHGRLVQLKGYGKLDYAVAAPPAEPTSLYDLASLTKVVATTTAAMILEEDGKLDLQRTVHSYLPEFDAPDKAAITVRMLLVHNGGIEAYAPLYRDHRGRADFLVQINARPLRSAPGTATMYSDWDMVLLQAVIERITGTTLDEFIARRVFQPLGMTDTRFVPDTSNVALRARIAATAVDTSRGGLLRGTVHDGNAWALGGVSGHAGLFSTASDLAVFAQLLLGGGSYGGVRIMAPTTVARWTARQGPTSSRALGWDTPAPAASSGRYFSPRSFGHTGFTGTSIWIDPERDLFLVLLMNRVNSRGASTNHTQVRRDVADAVQRSILDAPLIDWEARR